MTDFEQLPADFRQFIAGLKRNLGGIFAPGRDVFIARAPARLDILGGIADYAGSLALSSTLPQATIVAVQKRLDRRIVMRNLNADPARFINVEFHLDDFFQGDKVKSYPQLRERLTGDPGKIWAAYLVGALPILLNEKVIAKTQTGVNIAVSSTIPFAMGLGASAALEAAHMLALLEAFGIAVDGSKIAKYCQMVENHIVGSPCGIMDQMSSILGQDGKVLAAKCQPHDIVQVMSLPNELRLFGISSGIRNDNCKERNRDLRVATFMGRKILFNNAQTLENATPYGQYLCNVNEEDWQTRLRKVVPFRMPGREFVTKYNSHEDAITSINPDKRYNIRSAMEHAILENHRAHGFLDFLRTKEETNRQANLEVAGQLMADSHKSYSANCKLGAKETDQIVLAIGEQGYARGLYGARVMSSGCGGTVVILAERDSEDLLRTIASRYADAAGLEAQVFMGSSPGALQTGVVKTKFD